MPWETEEFVPLNDFDGTVKSAQWKVGMGGFPQLELHMQVHEVYDPVNAAAQETNAWYSAGRKGWDIVDGGLRVVPAQVGQKFHNKSKYGMLLDRVSKELRATQVVSKGEPEEAVIWIGERFRWKRETASYSGLAAAEGETPRDVDTTVLLPVEYRTAGAVTAPAPATPVEAAAPVSKAAYAISDADLTILQEVAKGKSSDNEGYAVKLAAARDQRLQGNNELMAAIMNDSLLMQLEAEGKLTVQDGVYQ